MAMAIMILVGGLTGLYGVSTVSDDLKEVSQIRLPAVMGLDMMTEAKTALHRTERTVLLPEIAGNSSERARQTENIAKALSRADKGQKMYEALPKTKEEEAAWGNLKPAWETWKKDNQQVVDLALDGKRDEALAYSTGPARQSFYAMEKFMAELVTLNTAVAEERQKHAQSQEKLAKSLTIFGTLLGIIAALAFGFLFSRSITKPVQRIVADISEGSDQVSTAAGQVSTSSQLLAEGASEQASAVEETSSTLEELSAMTKQNASHAGQAKTMMDEALKIINRVNTDMQNMAEAIEEVARNSEETSRIIKTIDEIAFQTNLLALNAAVEAARAGEAGAGFAVVADEVRNLAMRAAEAAKNTSSLIENTVRSIQNSHELTKIAQEAYKENMDISGKINGLIGEIDAASQEQAQGINQINKAVAEMDKVIQQNAATAEESASASEEMNAQAAEMKKSIQELVVLVRGKTNGNGNREKRTAAEKSEQGAARAFGFMKRPAIGTGRDATGKNLQADKIIPMKEGQDFKDF
jgi:methyl-accepting chemotaxis protein